MPQVTNTDIRELKDLIQGLDRKMELGFADADRKFADADRKMELGFADLKGQVTNLETKLDAKIDNLETKLDAKIDNLETKLDGKIDTVNSRLTNIEANTRTIADLAEKVGELKNWKQIAIVVFTASVSGAIAWFVRGGVKP